MAVVYSPNIIEIAVIQEVQGQPCVNVWHMWFDAELGSDTKLDVVTDFRDNWQDHVALCQSSAVAYVRFEWRSIDPSDNEVGVLAPNPAKNLGGAISAEAAPVNVAYLVHKRTVDRPRGRRDGRCFLPGVVENQVDPRGTVASGFRADLNDALQDFYDGISDTSGSAAGDRYPAVLETTPASRAPGTAAVTIDSRRVRAIELDTLVATQRDRLR